MTTTKQTTELQRGDIIDLGFTKQAVLRVHPPKGLTTYWVVDTADSDTHHGSSQGVAGDKVWTVTGTTQRLRRTPSALEKALTL
jgi:hypothetical protein